MEAAGWVWRLFFLVLHSVSLGLWLALQDDRRYSQNIKAAEDIKRTQEKSQCSMITNKDCFISVY